MFHIFYNPIAGNGQGDANSKQLEQVLKGEELKLHNILFVQDLKTFFDKIALDDKVVLLGGDGTLNRFVNNISELDIKQEIYYYAGGSGNDFARDVKEDIDEKGFVKLDKYIKNLPLVTVKGKTYRFLNGVGFGLDGYCCEEGDKERGKSDKPVNYATIALKGLFYGYKRTNATIIVDGEEHKFEDVWLAPTMNGKYYGSGMMIAPMQDRLNETGSVSCLVFSKVNKLRALTIFPSIFKGTHTKYTKYFKAFSGHDITVRFDKPTALQIDGETVSNVTEYHVNTCK